MNTILKKITLAVFCLSSLFVSGQGAITDGIKNIKPGSNFIITEGRYDSGKGSSGKLIAFTNNGKSLKVEVTLEEILLDSAKDGIGNQHIKNLRFSFKDDKSYVTTTKGSEGIFPTNIRLKFNNSYSTSGKVYLVDGAFVMTNELGTGAPQSKDAFGITYILSKKKLAGLVKENTEDYTKFHDAVWNYMVNAAELEKKAIAEAEEKEKQRVAKEKKDNSLEGKKVKSIELVADGKNVGYGDDVKVNVIATLKDGTQLKTKGIGGKTWLDDYIFTSDVGTGTKVGDRKSTPNDAIKITVQSKFHPDLKDTKEVILGFSSAKTVIDLTSDLNINMCTGRLQPSGKDGSKGDCSKGQAAGDGTDGVSGVDGKDLSQDIEVNVGSFKHKKTGETILSYEITSGSFTKKFFCLQGAEVVVFAKGGCGQAGSDGGDGGEVKVTGNNTDCDCASSASYMGRGGDGGNGGNGGNGPTLTLTVDPSVSTYNLITNVEGGGGGNAGKGGRSRVANTCNSSMANSISNAKKTKAGKDGIPGKKGMDGKVTKQSAKVSID